MQQQLKDQIEELETQASTTSPDDKEALYDLLVVAFFKAKDLITLLEDEKPSDVSEVLGKEITSLKANLDSLRTDYKDCSEALANRIQEIDAVSRARVESMKTIVSLSEALTTTLKGM